jgi:FKBP-type peptidyl-prolyl cis-trans isomerase
MRSSLLLVCLLAAALAACGAENGASDSAPQAASSRSDPRAAAVTEVQGRPTPPEFELPPGPPPKKVVFRDLEEGQGARIKRGDFITTNYIALDYKTGDRVEENWGERPFRWWWDEGELTVGWLIGLRGMRVGGRRELLVPSKLAYGDGSRAYIVELLAVEEMAIKD